ARVVGSSHRPDAEANRPIESDRAGVGDGNEIRVAPVHLERRAARATVEDVRERRDLEEELVLLDANAGVEPEEKSSIDRVEPAANVAAEAERERSADHCQADERMDAFQPKLHPVA